MVSLNERANRSTRSAVPVSRSPNPAHAGSCSHSGSDRAPATRRGRGRREAGPAAPGPRAPAPGHRRAPRARTGPASTEPVTRVTVADDKAAAGDEHVVSPVCRARGFAGDLPLAALLQGRDLTVQRRQQRTVRSGAGHRVVGIDRSGGHERPVVGPVGQCLQGRPGLARLTGDVDDEVPALGGGQGGIPLGGGAVPAHVAHPGRDVAARSAGEAGDLVTGRESSDGDPAAEPAGAAEDEDAHWCTILLSVVSDRPLMHPWSPPGHRHGCSTVEVQHEFCEVRWPRTPRPATGLCADERRSVSDRLRGPGTTGCSLTARTARKQ